jgi:hypothetical protein
MSKQKSSNGGTKNGTTNGGLIPMSRAGEERLTVPLSAILPSPDKVGPDGKFHPEATKVDALVRSMDALGEWTEAIHCVPGPKPGTYYQWEQHTRKYVLEQKYGPNHKVPIVVESLTPQMRLQRMAESNGEEYGATPTDRAEICRAGVMHFADRLPALVESGTVPAIDANAPRYYNAKSETPFASVLRNGDLPLFAYTSKMLAAYVFMNERTVQRALAVCNGADRLNIAPADYISGLQRDDSERVGRVMAAMGERDKRPLSEKSQNALRSFSSALSAIRNGDAVTVTANGKGIDLTEEKNANKIADAIRTGKFAVTVATTSKSKSKGRKGTTGARKSVSVRKRAQVAKMADAFKSAAGDLKKYRVAKGGMQWTPEDVTTVREAAEAFVALCKERIAVATKVADVTKVRGRKVAKKK